LRIKSRGPSGPVALQWAGFKKILDLLAAALVFSQPAVLDPISQAHAHRPLQRPFRFEAQMMNKDFNTEAQRLTENGHREERWAKQPSNNNRT
jgi:hypothetical protein